MNLLLVLIALAIAYFVYRGFRYSPNRMVWSAAAFAVTVIFAPMVMDQLGVTLPTWSAPATHEVTVEEAIA